MKTTTNTGKNQKISRKVREESVEAIQTLSFSPKAFLPKIFWHRNHKTNGKKIKPINSLVLVALERKGILSKLRLTYSFTKINL